MEYKEELKLRNLSKKLVGLVKSSTPTDIYDELVRIWRKQSDYFMLFDPSFLLKLVIYVYSFKKTSGFELSDNILKNMFFAHLLEPTGVKYEGSCDNCGGDGVIDCDECSRTGREPCRDCNGDGELKCGECEGFGEIEDPDEENYYITCQECNGKGYVNCDRCEGDGEELCNNCGGNGYFDCDVCKGNGEVETDEDEFNLWFICSWNPELYNILEITENTDRPAFDIEDFDKGREDVLVLKMEREHIELEDFVIEEHYYCYSLKRNPKILRNLSGKLVANESDDYQYYIK